MRVLDFGRFDGPVVLFGGPYSNVQALQALAEIIGDTPAICTGDVVAYCADPRATIDLIRARRWPVVAGNCERQIAQGSDNCGCGFGADSACDILSRGWYPFALQACTAEDRRWMADCPDIGVIVAGEARYAVIHGGATSINRFLWPTSDTKDFESEIDEIQAHTGHIDGVIAGHCGIAFQRRIGRHHWINPGAIGLPPHDGRPQTRYAVLKDGQVVIHRLDYDHVGAKHAMNVKGLTQGYHEALETGIWPSQDILPNELRR